MVYSMIFGVAGLILALLITPWIIRLGVRGVGLDRPDSYRKSHLQPVSRLGGVPLFMAFVLAVAAVLYLRHFMLARWLPVLATSGLMFGVGLWDDFRPLGARLKLFCQVMIAILALTLGLSIKAVTYPGGAAWIWARWA